MWIDVYIWITNEKNLQEGVYNTWSGIQYIGTYDACEINKKKNICLKDLVCWMIFRYLMVALKYFEYKGK